MVGIGRGIKTLMENVLIYLVIVACIVKANLFSLIYFFCIFGFNTFISNQSKRMVATTILVAVGFLLQYLSMLSNLSADISPKTMPNDSWKPFPIPWYHLISGDEKEANDWAYYLSLGN